MSRNNQYVDHLKTGRSQLKRLATIERHLYEMAEAWDDLDNGMNSDLYQLIERVCASSGELKELITEWKSSHEWDGE